MLKIRRKKLFNTKKQSVYLIALFFVSVFMGVGYSYLSSTLSVNGSTTVYKNNWGIEFSSYSCDQYKGASCTVDSSTSNTTVKNYQVVLPETGSYIDMRINVYNRGSIDAMIGSIVDSGITSEQAKYIDYSLTYGDTGAEIKEKDLLPAHQWQKMRIKIKYKDLLNDTASSNSSLLPREDQTLNLTLNINYVQADNAHKVNNPTCIRARDLHKVTCSNRSASGGCQKDGHILGQDFTFGNYGTSGILTPGDAFDCDIDNDNRYEPDTERFYYMHENNYYATLMYYSNVINGEPVSAGAETQAAQYDPYDDPQNNGPSGTFIGHLPAFKRVNELPGGYTAWVKDETGKKYSKWWWYTSHNSRLPRVSDFTEACNKSFDELLAKDDRSHDGVIYQNCPYLLEGTQYSRSDEGVYALENFSSTNSQNIFYVSGWARAFGSAAASGNYAIRPVIDLYKSQISY